MAGHAAALQGQEMGEEMGEEEERAVEVQVLNSLRGGSDGRLALHVAAERSHVRACVSLSRCFALPCFALGHVLLGSMMDISHTHAHARMQMTNTHTRPHTTHTHANHHNSTMRLPGSYPGAQGRISR